MKEQSDTRPRARNVSGLRPQWQKGVSGNPAGRPRGSRNRLGEEFFDALCAEWTRRGEQALASLTGAELVNVVLKVLPKETRVETGSEWADLLRRAAEVMAEREAAAAVQ